MKLKLTVIAAALALGFAGAAQAQSTTPRTDVDKPRTADRADRKVKNADEERIESEYKAAKEKCDPMKGNEKDICQAEAKAKEKIAKAENDAKHAKDPAKAQAHVQRVKADAEYDVAKERCDDRKGNDKDVCMKEAKVQRDKARAGSARTERSATTGSTAPEKR
jgi:hypothetical protein